LSDRSRAALPQASIVLAAGVLLLILASRLSGQNPAASLTLFAKDQRRAIPITVIGTQEFVALDDLASAFQLTVREEGGAVTVSYRGRTIVLTADQALASVAGRLISLPAPPTRSGSRWLVPEEFISRALALVYDQRLELRRPSRLVLIGDVRVPRVTIRYEPLATATRLTIDATPRAASTIAPGGTRLLIKFDADAVDAAIPAFQSQGFVSALRMTDPITLDIELGPRFSTFRASTEVIDDTTRLVIDIVGADTSTSAAPARGAAPAAPGPAAPATAAPGAPATPGLPAGVAPPPAPEPLPLSNPPAAIRTIVLDAGHGGDDTGVKGPGGTAEKDLTLAIARRMRAAIEARLGVRVLLTRDDDRNVGLDDRVAIANNSKADLFISLHANGSLRGQPTGAAIYVASLGETPQSALTPERLPTLSGGSRDIEMVEWDRAQLRYLDASSRFADILRAQMQGRVPLDDHQPLATAPFRVLESANMPAVLVEVGYLTTPEQEQQIAGADFQNGFAQAAIDAVLKFRDYLDENGAEIR
jgi:N-acetylmuramoyl-L-alanine amidase